MPQAVLTLQSEPCLLSNDHANSTRLGASIEQGKTKLRQWPIRSNLASGRVAECPMCGCYCDCFLQIGNRVSLLCKYCSLGLREIQHFSSQQKDKHSDELVDKGERILQCGYYTDRSNFPDSIGCFKSAVNSFPAVYFEEHADLTRTLPSHR